MSNEDLTQADLDALREFDTPTICNSLELLAPERRGYGYTVDPLICSYPDLPPMVGYARTATIRAMHPAQFPADEMKARRIAYFEYVEMHPRPSIIVVQDIDQVPGYGSFWGEVQSNVHKGLGALGTITNGCVRDIPDCAEGFQFISGSVKPSHAFVHVVQFGTPVTIAGMDVSPDDLIHADQHGAVVIPKNVARDIPRMVDLVTRREQVVIKASCKPGFSAAVLKEALMKQEDIH